MSLQNLWTAHDSVNRCLNVHVWWNSITEPCPFSAMCFLRPLTLTVLCSYPFPCLSSPYQLFSPCSFSFDKWLSIKPNKCTIHSSSKTARSPRSKSPFLANKSMYLSSNSSHYTSYFNQTTYTTISKNITGKTSTKQPAATSPVPGEPHHLIYTSTRSFFQHPQVRTTENRNKTTRNQANLSSSLSRQQNKQPQPDQVRFSSLTML